MTGLETRVYQNGARAFHYSPYAFEPDIAALVRNTIEKQQENVFYIETEDLLIFGVIKVQRDDTIVMVGPTARIRPGKPETIAALYMLGEPYSRLPELEGYFANMIPYPFETFLAILCFVNYALNEEKLSVADLIRESEPIPRMEAQAWVESTDDASDTPHNTFQAEKLMLSYVSTGNVAAIEGFMQAPPTGKIGSIAPNELRQRKNTFVCAATIISRAAIAGGVPSEIAFALSDNYIQKAELLKNGGDITALNMEMLLDYTRRVEALKCGTGSSKLAKEAKRYILKHISSKISIDDIAAALQINRSHLCEHFKQETGITVGEFITATKIDEAKRMLCVSELSVAQISDYLAFSSQSYFQNVFKKLTGCTPKEYRQKM